MALTLLSANNASTVLSAGISASATTLTVNTGTGGLFPSPVSGTSFFKLTLIDSATGTLTEIVHVTDRSGDTMTIVRGQEGTVSRLWSANDIAANMMTAGTLDLLSQKAQSLQIANNLSDLASPQTALTNLGVPSSSLIPIGVPLPYPLATPPAGFLKCNGSSFSTAEYPKLALAYPSGVLPDLRGEFIRGWDDGRGVDSGRVVLTGQSQSVQQHTHDLAMAYSSESGYKDRLGASPNSDIIPIKDMINVTTFTGSGEYYLKANDSTGVETRPRNVAFNYIVRAV